MAPVDSSGAGARPAPGPSGSLDQWLAYLESIHPTEIDLGLDRVLVVLRRLFPRRPAVRIVTVGGTNGKGSCVAALEALLQAAGRRTGAYTSPHLHRYNERVRLNGRDIDDASLVRAFDRVEQARQNISLTYFEFGTLAAFVAMDEAGLDDWLLEVGLGGRLDAVNVLDTDLAILTSVDLDHQAFLGDNRESIGFEKAGIFRQGRPAIYADVDPPRSVLQQAAAQKVPLQRLGEQYALTVNDALGTPVLQSQGARILLPAGPLPVNSVAAAVVAVRSLAPELPVADIERTLSVLAVPGRFETLKRAPAVIADVGHNPHAARWLAGRLASTRRPGQPVYAVYGALADKDVEGVVAALSDVVDRWWLAPLSVPRGLDALSLARRVQAGGVDGAVPCESVSGALDCAIAEAGARDALVVVFGSFFTVGEARAVLAGTSDRGVAP